MAISLSMMYIGGIQWYKLGTVLCIYAVVAVGAGLYKIAGSHSEPEPTPTEMAASGQSPMVAMSDVPTGNVNRTSTWAERVKRFRGDSIPLYDKPIDAKNRQEMYSYMAQANGGLFGVIPGNSRETARLPLAFSDYIFAIIIEDLGFVGAMFIMFLYLSLLARAASIARRCTRAFPALLVLGMAVMITFQALFHMAIVSGVFPVSGQPLPLFSKGGTSILITSLAFGIMLSVSRHAVRNNNKQDIRNELNSLPENMRAENPTQF
jgi:cell division protein FtsW